MSQKIKKSVLPFSTLSEDRQEPFPKNSERAAIFCLADLERAKGGGLVLKHPPEKLEFIAAVCYPLWLVPLDEMSLLFDGLNTTSQTLNYLTIPDIHAFIDNLKRSSRTPQAYLTFLSDNLNYFRVSGNEEEKVIDGLITDPEFLDDFTQYLQEGTPIKTSSYNRVTVSPTLDESAIISATEELQKLKSKFEEEVDLLYSSMKLTKEKTENFLKSILNEIEEIEEEFNEKIKKSKAYIAEKIEEINKEYDEKVTDYSKEVEEEILSLQREKIKLEKTKERSTNEIGHCEAEIKTCKINKDHVSERKWKEERKKLKEQLSEAEKRLKELDQELRETKDGKKAKILELKSERDSKTKEVEKDLVEIESSRDAKIKIWKEEIEKFEELTSTIIKQINELAKMREKAIDEFEKLGIQQKQEEYALIYMPFYLACYKSDPERRYAHFPPSIVNSVGLSVKFKGALGKTKIRQLLEPRSKTITSLLSNFLLVMKQNPVFNREMNEGCAQAGLLRTEESRESIKKGLEDLREEGWLSEKEHEAFIEVLESVQS